MDDSEDPSSPPEPQDRSRAAPPAWGTPASAAATAVPPTEGVAPRPAPARSSGGKVLRVVGVVALAVTALAVLGVLALVLMVTSAIDSGEEGPVPTTSPALGLPDLLSPAEWSTFVAAVEQESGDSRVHRAVLFDGYATLEMPADKGTLRGLYRGRFIPTSRVATSETFPQEPVDLRTLDVAVLRELRERAPRDAQLSDATTSHLVVSARDPVPVLIVTVSADGIDTQSVRYDLDGERID